MKIIHAFIIAVAIFAGLGLVAYAVSLNGRFMMVQRENNRMVLLDTRTGQFWDHGPRGRFVGPAEKPE